MTGLRIPSRNGGRPAIHRLLILWALLLAAAPLTSVSAAPYPYGGTHPDRLKFPALKFAPVEPVKRVLPNGMTLYLLEDHELPLFNAIAYIRTGSIYEPADKVGLAALTGMVMRTGGTDRRTGDEIDAALEFVGGSVETSIGEEYGTAHVSTLQKDADTGLEILSEVLRRPAFRQDKLELARRQVIEGIRRKNDQPSEIADRIFTQALYGQESPWAREPTIEGVSKITREDLAAFHARTFAPNQIILAVAGDMSVDEMVRRIERQFGDWPRKEVSLPAVQPAPEKITPGVLLVPRAGTQANIRIGHLGIPRHTPDLHAVRVMNYILGTGGFSSRLMREVRSNRGLAYAVWGYLGEGRDRGIFEMGAETKQESTPEAVAAMRATLTELVRGPVGAAELAAAKDALLNSFVFRFQSRFQIVSQRAMLEMLGFPADYLTTYQQRIAAVTAADVQRVAREYLHPDRLVVVVVSPPEGLGQQLADVGPARVVPLGAPR